MHIRIFNEYLNENTFYCFSVKPYYLTVTMILSQTLSIANKSNENGNLGHLGNQDSNKNNQILLEYPRFESVFFIYVL